MRRYAIRGRGDVERAISGPAYPKLLTPQTKGGEFYWLPYDTQWKWAERARTTQMQDQQMAQEVASQNRWAANGQKFVPRDARMNPHVDLKLRASLDALAGSIAGQKPKPRSIMLLPRARDRAKYSLAGLR